MPSEERKPACIASYCDGVSIYLHAVELVLSRSEGHKKTSSGSGWRRMFMKFALCPSLFVEGERLRRDLLPV